MNLRLAYVRSWEGPPPKEGDQLRSKAARYLIVAIVWCDGLNPLPRRFTLARIKPGDVEGGTIHPWAWSGRGRARAPQSRKAST